MKSSRLKGIIGYSVSPCTGMVERGYKDRFSTLDLYWANKGECFSLEDNDEYEFAVATYGTERPEQYIYTYDYEVEEKWVNYNNDLTENSYRTDTYIFEKDCYFRIIVRRSDGYGLSKEDEIVINNLMRFDGQGKKFIPNPCFTEEISRTIDSVNSLTGSKYIILTDSHYTVNGTWDDTIDNIRKVVTQTGIDGIIHLGDFTDGMISGAINAKYVDIMKSDLKSLGLPLYIVLGNHDSNYFRSNPDTYDDKRQQELYETPLFYSSDIEEQKIRMFFLSSFDYREQERYGFSDEEVNWFENELGKVPNDYRILIFSHVPPLAGIHYWSDVIRNGTRMVDLVEDFQKDRGLTSVLAWIHGHNHSEQIYTGRRFPIVSLGCNKCEYFTDKKPNGSITYYRQLETVTQDLWDILTITGKELFFTRFGAGEDKYIPVREEERMKKVITYGTFDLFHEGHYNLLKRAKELGDYLIAGITTEHFDEARGKVNVVDSIIERIDNVRKTGFADEIIVEDHDGQKVEDIQKYNIDVFTVGSDWTGHFDYLKDYCDVIYLPRTPNISSTYLRKSRFPIIRIGIVGTGRVAPRFIDESKYVSGLNIRCAYNPIKESAEIFGKKHELECFTEKYEEFLEKVDAVYIASPSETHYDYAKQALSYGKHVLCEKPLSFTREEAIELYKYAHSKNLVLMEGVKAAYCPGFQQMLAIAKSGKIGEIKDVEACFSRITNPGLREVADARYGGAFLEFGGYPLLPIIKLLGMDYKEVQINSIYGDNGVDLYTKIQLCYQNGLAMAKTGVGVKSEGQLVIAGTKGYILAQSPWWLTRRFEVRYEDPNKIEVYEPEFKGDGLRYEINEFITKINGTNKNEYRLTAEESIAMAGIVEQFMNKRKKEQNWQ